jgi:hypothetical protein
VIVVHDGQVVREGRFETLRDDPICRSLLHDFVHESYKSNGD